MFVPFKNIGGISNQAIIPIQGVDKEHIPLYKEGMCFVLAQHEDADFLDPGDTELAVWIGNAEGICKETHPFTCHVGDCEAFDHWEAQALQGQLLAYLIQEWGSL